MSHLCKLLYRKNLLKNFRKFISQQRQKKDLKSEVLVVHLVLIIDSKRTLELANFLELSLILSKSLSQKLKWCNRLRENSSSKS